MRKRLSAILLAIAILAQSNFVQAEVNFKKNYAHYEELCSRRASYEMNKKVCNDFDKYKTTNSDAVEKMEASINDSDLSADKLAKLIRKNDELINSKDKQLKKSKVKIAKNKAKIKKLNKVVSSSLALVQHFSDENHMIDVVMGSSNIDDLMTRVDGIKAINTANLSDVITIEESNKELEKEKRYLDSDIKSLKKVKNKQKALLIEFQRKEAVLYSGSNSGGNATFNSGLNSVKLSNIKDSKKMIRPVKRATVSATTWYYPNGGWHPGIDFATSVGSKIIAPANGVLLAKSSSGGGGYGNHMITAVKHKDYVYTMLFAHMNSFVNVNSFKQGELIGYTGNTGASTGPHVHVEVFRHNTNDLSVVVNQFKKNNDYWFGLGYSGKGDCTKVCRIQPSSIFNVKLGQTF